MKFIDTCMHTFNWQCISVLPFAVSFRAFSYHAHTRDMCMHSCTLTHIHTYTVSVRPAAMSLEVILWTGVVLLHWNSILTGLKVCLQTVWLAEYKRKKQTKNKTKMLQQNNVIKLLNLSYSMFKNNLMIKGEKAFFLSLFSSFCCCWSWQVGIMPACFF